jgi:hypothetical protein
VSPKAIAVRGQVSDTKPLKFRLLLAVRVAEVGKNPKVARLGVTVSVGEPSPGVKVWIQRPLASVCTAGATVAPLSLLVKLIVTPGSGWPFAVTCPELTNDPGVTALTVSV